MNKTLTSPGILAQAALSDLDIAKMHCEGRSLLVDSRTIGIEMLPNYSPGYVRALLCRDDAPAPLQVANNGSYLFARLEIALFLLQHERITVANRRARTAAATAKRLRDYARPGGGRRLRQQSRKTAASVASTQ